MANNISLAATVAAAMAQALADKINAGSGAGTLCIYSGTQPATADTAITTQTLLAQLTFSDPCEASVTSGVITFDTITPDTSANATGTATWFRIYDSDSVAVMDGSVGTSGCDLNINSVSIVSGTYIGATSASITVVK